MFTYFKKASIAIVFLFLTLYYPLPYTLAKEKEGKVHCPKTLVTDQGQCSRCHVSPSWEIKETNPEAVYDYPLLDMKILDGKAYLYLTDIDYGAVRTFFDYVSWHPTIKHVVVDIFSPGGGMMSAWDIIGCMEYWKGKGYIVETRCRGMAASAGFMIFVAGTKGYRFVSPHALLMWHEIISIKFVDVSTPSDKEEEARILRCFQNNAHDYFAEKGNLTKEELNQLVHKKQFWFTGREAIKYGYADGLLK